jgi:hypothetical protein
LIRLQPNRRYWLAVSGHVVSITRRVLSMFISPIVAQGSGLKKPGAVVEFAG